MIQRANTPGLGLPWPKSWHAAVAEFGSARAASRFFGINECSGQRYCSGKAIPKHPSTRGKFMAKGYREGIELPTLAGQHPRNYDKWNYWTPEDKARVALFRSIWRRSEEKNPNARFYYALEDSANTDIKNPDLLAAWDRASDKKLNGQWDEEDEQGEDARQRRAAQV